MPATPPRPDICYVVSHGFAARMVMQSRILAHLRERDVSVAVAVPDVTDETVAAGAEAHGVRLIQTPPVSERYNFQIQLLRRYLFEDVRANPALWTKHVAHLDAPALKERLRFRAYYTLNRVALSSDWLQRRFLHLERLLLRRRSFDALLASLRPRLVVSTYPVELLEAFVLNAARRADLPTVGHLLSWDNITTKGRFPVPPDYYLAWGPIMQEEIEAYYGTPPERIYPCGVAHFDHYFQSENRDHADEIVRGLGLDPRRPYLFFGMSSPYIAPREIDIVEWLAEAVASDRFGSELQLVVRPHPQNVEGAQADPTWLTRLQAIVGPRVAVDFPALESSNLKWSMKPRDLPHLSNLIAGCAICLNSGSTLSIDAIVHDRPVICTGFDAAETDVPWYRSVRRMFTYPYMRKLVDLGGVRLVDSFEALDDAIRAYLADPGRDADGRTRTRSQECGPCDGRASEHVADALVDILERTGARAPQVTAA